MKRAIFAAITALTLAVPASADVTIKQTTTGKGLGMSGTTPGTTYIKGLKMRTEVVSGGTTRVTIFDVESQKMYSFDSKKKEADVYDMQTFAQDLGQSVDVSQMKATVTPNGETRTIAGHSAAGYDMEVSVPASMGGPDGPKMTINLVGPMWIVKGVPGADEYIKFFQTAVERGWIFSDPRAAKGMPGQAKAMAEMYRQLAETGGMPFETEMEIKMAGEGPMAAIMGRMGGVSSKTTVESVETGPLSDDLFAPPAGYKLNNRK